jgi:hypothetical protein
MTRLTLALAAWLSVVSVVSAALAPRKETPAFREEVPQGLASQYSARALQQTARATNSEFVLTHETEVLLNGKPCKYAEIPRHARIVHMEVAEDEKTVLKIHFRTGK